MCRFYMWSATDKDLIFNFKDTNKQSLIAMACGGKDVGKSTLLRYLVNGLLNK